MWELVARWQDVAEKKSEFGHYLATYHTEFASVAAHTPLVYIYILFCLTLLVNG